MTKILRVVYYVSLVLIVSIAILFTISVLPIPGNYKVLVVESGSMEPAIKVGSIVVIRPEKEYKTGDIITFIDPSQKSKVPTTHRIYEIEIVSGEIRYVTKGDANNTPDTKSVRKRDILGKVLVSIPYLGYGVAFAKKPIGFLLIIFVPVIIIILDEVRNIYVEIKKRRKDKKN